MGQENKKPIFDLLKDWQCPVEWDRGIADARMKLSNLLQSETMQYAEFLDTQFCDQVQATAAMALDYIFEEHWGVLCDFDDRGAKPMISVSIGTHGEYLRKFSFAEIITQEVSNRTGHDGDPKDANQFLRKLISILENHLR